MLAAGAEHTAAVTESGKLYGWGWGRYGNLGLGDRNDRLVPGEVAAVPVCLLPYILHSETSAFPKLRTWIYSDCVNLPRQFNIHDFSHVDRECRVRSCYQQ